MKQKIPLAEAKAIADEWVSMLAPYCERVEIAGSIRRQKLEVGDIEIVCKPIMKSVADLFGMVVSQSSEIDAFFGENHTKLIKNGSKYKQAELESGIDLDLFCVIEPAQWGVIFMIRTGSADFSHRMVTSKQQRGLMPSNFKVQDGAVWSNGHIIATPEEADVFRLWGMEYIEPRERI